MKKVIKEVTLFETGDVVDISKMVPERIESPTSIKAKNFKASGGTAMILYTRETKEGITYGALLDNCKLIAFSGKEPISYIGHIDVSLLLNKNGLQ